MPNNTRKSKRIKVLTDILIVFVTENIENRPIYIIAGLNDPVKRCKNVPFIQNGLLYQLEGKTVSDTEGINWSSFEKLLLEPKYFNEINHADTTLSSFITQIREQYAELAYLFIEYSLFLHNHPSDELIHLLQEGPLMHAIMPKFENYDDSNVHSKINNH